MTGKNALILVGNDQLFPMAFQQYKQVLTKAKLSNNQQQVKQVKRVGKRIQKAVEAYLKSQGNGAFLKDYRWDFNVIQDNSQINAWCMPGGKVAFYTGILPICQDETGIAVVMGHEITHALAEHSAQQYSKALIAQGINVAGNVALKDKSRQIFNQLYGPGSQLGMLAFSRNHELEADRIGLKIMAMAGYDPREAPRFWERMQRASQTSGKQSPPEFFSTHPNPGRRIQQLKSLLPEVLPIYEKAKKRY